MRSTMLARRISVLVVAVGLMAAATAARAQERWKWSITPYMWATDISDTLTLDGTIVGGGDTEFDDLVDKIDTSLQLHFEGIRDRWGLFADLTYTELSDSETGEQGLLLFEVDIEETLSEAGAIWRPGGASGRFELLFGGRWLSVDERYRLSLGDFVPLETRIDEDYLDALVAVRYLLPLSDRWSLSLRGDVSAGDTDYIWTAQGLVGWRFGARRGSALFFGYRYREMKYTKDVYEVEKTLSGLGLGVKIGF